MNFIDNKFTREQLLEAHNDGSQAYSDDVSKDDNPFDNNDEWDLNQAWVEGWDCAAWND